MEGGRGQGELLARVINQGLCTGCGACSALCPYFAVYRDRTVALHKCDLSDGRCYSFCPRTGLDLSRLQENLTDKGDLTPELGPVKGYHLVRAADERVRKTAQHGGTVTALMSFALGEGLIEEAILSEGAGRFSQQGVTVRAEREIQKMGKSRFLVSPVIAELNRAAREAKGKIGIVATPCQVQALAKMRLRAAEEENPSRNLTMIIGLFCGWTLDWRGFVSLLGAVTRIEAICGMDIHPKKDELEIYTGEGSFAIEMERLRPLIRPACSYCFDTTAEFSDISVGSARLKEDWSESKTWNQLIVRSARGEEIVKQARERGVLEFRPVPPGTLGELKKAARKKKETALTNLIKKSGGIDQLGYLTRQDPAVSAIFSGLGDI